MKIARTATVYICDGCAARTTVFDDDDMPPGITIEVFEINASGAATGELYVCTEPCLLPAFRRRTNIWKAQA